jgi:methylmalonyl-CoA/ethylmalonyl-CoA epimerase
MIRSLHHIGIAVRDVEQASAFYAERLGITAAPVESPPGSTLRFALISMPGAALEFIAPAADETPITRFLDRRGPGVHHIAFSVGDIKAAMSVAAQRGLKSLTEEPQPGVGGHLTCFFHPADTLGVLVEYVEDSS